MNGAIDPRVADLVAECGLDTAGASSVAIEGCDPMLPSRFPLGEAAATALAAGGVAAANLARLQSGRSQGVNIRVDVAAATLSGAAMLRMADDPDWRVADARTALVGRYQCADGRWFMVHGRLPHLAAAVQRVLGIQCEATTDSVAAAVRRWNSAELEDAMAAARQCGAINRTAEEWAAHPQGQTIAAMPRVEVIKLADGPPMPLPDHARPLGGVRVLDLTRILAGPTCARTLAAFGADVLHITSPRLPTLDHSVLDTNHGKLAAYLELEEPSDQQRLVQLVRESDVFAQGYRAGSLERRGFGPRRLIAERPGLVYVSINCYGHEGPWRERPGWEQLAQTVSGLTAAEGAPDRPQALPVPANDYTTGYLAALGTMTALYRRATEGGSYHVRAALCYTANWLYRLGPLHDPSVAKGLGNLDDHYQTTETHWGPLRHLKPAVQMSDTPAYWSRPVVPLGTHAPEWSPPAR